MKIGEQERALGLFPNRYDVEFALSELKDASFPMDKVSVVARDGSIDEEIADVNVSNSLKENNTANDNQGKEDVTKGAIAGGALGGITGLLIGISALAIPGVGSLTIAGSLITAVSSGAIGAATGGLIGALISLGIPEEKAILYNQRVAQGEYLVMIEGSEDDMRQAASILLELGIIEWKVYNNTPNFSDAK